MRCPTVRARHHTTVVDRALAVCAHRRLYLHIPHHPWCRYWTGLNAPSRLISGFTVKGEEGSACTFRRISPIDRSASWIWPLTAPRCDQGHCPRLAGASPMASGLLPPIPGHDDGRASRRSRSRPLTRDRHSCSPEAPSRVVASAPIVGRGETARQVPEATGGRDFGPSCGPSGPSMVGCGYQSGIVAPRSRNRVRRALGVCTVAPRARFGRASTALVGRSLGGKDGSALPEVGQRPPRAHDRVSWTTGRKNHARRSCST